MHDSELKELLQKTCPVRPGQEPCAWAALRERLYADKSASRWAWLYYPTWRGLAVGGFAVVLTAALGNFVYLGFAPISLATVDSQSPGIYATSFYSNSARAQVVWLNGMEPATDSPTYLDPTTVVADESETPQPASDPNSL